ncbi:TPA: hypothetical protein H7D48_004315 [Escherichia coli]|uniref:hypothetical protein n=1 Tax=Escherichia coli TaxID=562 RepID=UPI000942B330|nr:hypothetical protein [Escherichia coli]MBS9068888.1 hypothetical protein [Escherichia coli]MDA6081002.1 hypothetical protein [Escherichia coli]OKT31802.1 hypothetical protein ACN66_10960 [Escherichia coli]OKT42714.1 hypothetical protein ACN63_09680 [Escherichia coli]OKT53616.1 hypothetical protein ACN64_16025 [Escherichia coli]
MNTVTTMNTAVKTVRETTTAPTFFASPVAANEDYSDVRMTLTDLIEFVGLEERRDSIIRRIKKLAEHGIIQLPQIVEVKNHKNQSVDEYIFEGKKGRIDSIVLVIRSGKGDKAAELVERWDYLENEFLKKEEENKSPFPDASKMTKLDWMREAVKLEEEKEQLIHEKEQLVDLHIRRAIDAHSLTRLLGEKRGSGKVQRILKGLCEAKHIERRLDASGKPNGYDVLQPAYMYARQSAHGQLEFTVDVLPVLVKLGLIEEEQRATLKLPQPNNARAIVNKNAALIRQNVGSLAVFGI